MLFEARPLGRVFPHRITLGLIAVTGACAPSDPNITARLAQESFTGAGASGHLPSTTHEVNTGSATTLESSSTGSESESPSPSSSSLADDTSDPEPECQAPQRYLEPSLLPEGRRYGRLYYNPGCCTACESADSTCPENFRCRPVVASVQDEAKQDLLMSEGDGPWLCLPIVGGPECEGIVNAFKHPSNPDPWGGGRWRFIRLLEDGKLDDSHGDRRSEGFFSCQNGSVYFSKVDLLRMSSPVHLRDTWARYDAAHGTLNWDSQLFKRWDLWPKGK